MTALTRLRRGRSSPETPCSEASECPSGLGVSSRASSMAERELGEGASPGGTPPRSRSRSPTGSRRPPRSPLARALLRALLPALLLLLTATSMRRRRQQHEQLADQLLAAARPTVHGGGLGAAAAAAAGGAVDPGHACAEALQVPQVAMLFLVKGPLRHEALWRQWFERAAGLLPAQAVSNAMCASEEAMPEALAACSSLAGAQQAAAGSSSSEGGRGSSGSGKGISRNSTHSGGLTDWVLDAVWRPGGDSQGTAASSSSSGSDILERQHLFDVYVHPHPNYTGYAPGSLLYGKELPDSQRVTTEWGTHTLVDAAEALLAAALKNPRNTKFFMLSESDLPLYSPHVMYLQLMSEHRSRVNACNTTAGWSLDFYRWVDRMETPALKKHLWRKSSQWFVLNRAHAELVLADRQVERVFQEHCRTTWEEDRGQERVCYSDEHYIPTLLAVHNLDGETDCHGQFMDVDWSRVSSTSPHPWEYRPDEVGDHLFASLRRPNRRGCGNAAGALAAAPAAFLPQERLFSAAAAAEAGAASLSELEQLGREVCHTLLLHQQEQPKYPRIGPECPLMARKFSDGTQKAALAALAPCDSTSLILNDGRCPGETERQRHWRLLWWRWSPWVLLASAALACLPFLALLPPLRAAPRLLRRVCSRRDVGMEAPLLDV